MFVSATFRVFEGRLRARRDKQIFLSALMNRLYSNKEVQLLSTRSQLVKPVLVVQIVKAHGVSSQNGKTIFIFLPPEFFNNLLPSA